MKNIILGIMAHVDAGKTTLSESLLYTTGSIKKIGRVDKKDAYLDNFYMERQRGITIFSKEARFSTNDLQVTLLDTPGHVDFSAEMERTLQVIDYSVLVINGVDGVQSHTKTLWKLLKLYNIPVFIFVNKMDSNLAGRISVYENIKNNLGRECIDFSKDNHQKLYEELALCDESTMEKYLDAGEIEEDTISWLIAQRKVFPCFFGSALKMQGIKEFIEGLEKYVLEKKYKNQVGGKVYKISRDELGNRLTHMKITGGEISVRDKITYSFFDSNKISTVEEKINQIRVYSGEKYITTDKATAGTICTVIGLTKTYAGLSFGADNGNNISIIEPVLNYSLIFKDKVNINEAYLKIRILQEEDPKLNIKWNEILNKIEIQLMGQVQIEILEKIIKDRFNYDVTFSSGEIMYKETITEPVIGIGHFEPLRHYAEVQLLMEPLPQNSGMIFESVCEEDILSKNWQSMVINSLKEKCHKGIKTGSQITDIKITLIAGRAHKKHTEGGDFRNASNRAVRNGLALGKTRLLEPFYIFTLEIPKVNIGRALSDLERLHGEFEPPSIIRDSAVITGQAPVATMCDYNSEVMSYTKGIGKLNCTFGGYMKCHNEQEVIEAIGYEWERDTDNPAGSIFCFGGETTSILWNEVHKYNHSQTGIRIDEGKIVYGNQGELEETFELGLNKDKKSTDELIDYKELEEIFIRTYGPIKQRVAEKKIINIEEKVKNEYEYVRKVKKTQEKYLLIDGYNIIFSWTQLNELSKVNLDGARGKLIDIISNYQGYKKINVIIVFDAYKVKGNLGEVIKQGNITVVYTKQAQTADQYIERTAHEIGRKYDVTVATSDGLEQIIVYGQGCRVISARELLLEIEQVNKQIADRINNKNTDY